PRSAVGRHPGGARVLFRFIFASGCIMLQARPTMQDINPLSIVSRGFDEMTLTLAPCADPRTFSTADERKHAYIRWAVSYYVYAVIAHIRTVLHGLIALADSGNIP